MSGPIVPDIHGAKVMLCISWNQLGVVYLWAVEAKYNHHRGSVSNAIDAFEPSIGGETATLPRETWQNYAPAWQCSATCRKTGQSILKNAWMGGLTPPAVFFRRCSFRLPFVLFDGTRSGASAFSPLWMSHKMDQFVIASEGVLTSSTRSYQLSHVSIDKWLCSLICVR